MHDRELVFIEIGRTGTTIPMHDLGADAHSTLQAPLGLQLPIHPFNRIQRQPRARTQRLSSGQHVAYGQPAVQNRLAQGIHQPQPIVPRLNRIPARDRRSDPEHLEPLPSLVHRLVVTGHHPIPAPFENQIAIFLQRVVHRAHAVV